MCVVILHVEQRVLALKTVGGNMVTTSIKDHIQSRDHNTKKYKQKWLEDRNIKCLFGIFMMFFPVQGGKTSDAVVLISTVVTESINYIWGFESA